MKYIKSYEGTLKDLAAGIGNLHYDLTAIIIKKIADNITEKAYKENSIKGCELANNVYEAYFSLDSAWARCKDRMDGECVKHPRSIKGYSGTIENLAKDISDLEIHAFYEFLQYMGDDLLRQADADWNRGRKKLATNLYNAANEFYEAKYMF